MLATDKDAIKLARLPIGGFPLPVFALQAAMDVTAARAELENRILCVAGQRPARG